MKLDRYIDTFLDFIYPRNIYCILCNESIEKTEKYSLCQSCKEKINFIADRICEKCGKPLDDFYLSKECPDCIKTKHYFTKGFSCVEYNEHMKELVHKLKYKNHRYIAYHMAEMMISQLKKHDLNDIDYIVPVPLYKKKERKRGFNQSELLSKYIGKVMNWKVEKNNLIKIKDTKSQNQLNKDERKNNLENAFFVQAKEDFVDKNILLVDDVYTTGSTIDACSKEIRKAKPKEIYSISFATGKNINF
ncbi:ComF family protein [Crassaminicella profunda]|uniref:ComF family protein n=1 Tax=Crassaminicella profunda TaxID=1286698 RepID=UPI001CA60D6D|nr:ComF family protein [Crassaminicella profunda]QZY54324.1 ComF family protein [Crassaminicella profunda]